jgi:hypothetical protein
VECPPGISWISTPCAARHRQPRLSSRTRQNGCGQTRNTVIRPSKTGGTRSLPGQVRLFHRCRAASPTSPPAPHASPPSISYCVDNAAHQISPNVGVVRHRQRAARAIWPADRRRWVVHRPRDNGMSNWNNRAPQPSEPLRISTT